MATNGTDDQAPDSDSKPRDQKDLKVSDEITNSPTLDRIAPSFGALRPLIDAGLELIKLHHARAIGAKGQSLGKAPYKNWRIDPPLSADEAQQLMEEGHNIGVRLRPNDLVIDVDPRNFKDGDDPVKRLEADLKIRLDDWPTVFTGSDGRHHYMHMAEPILLSDTLEEYQGIELKAVGRQMVAPGSVHPETGSLYKVDPLADGFGSVPEAPASLLELARRPSGSSGAEPGEYSPEWLEGVLELLDPTQYRDQDKWLEMMMACHHATAGEGRHEFLAWSLSDPEYAGDEWIVGHRWDSLHADGDGKRVTVRTLFKHLEDAGVAHKVQPDHNAALADFADFMDDLPDPITEAEAKRSVLDKANADRFTVLTGGKYLVGRERTDPRTGEFTIEWYSPDAVKQHMNAKSIEMPDGKRTPLGTWWIGHPQRRQYDGVLFDPTPGADHPGWYNLWRGWAFEPRKGDWSKMQQLIRDVLCQGDAVSYDYVIKWMAHMVQCPSQPAEVALVFKGPKGAGKGTFCRALDDLAGKHGIHVTSPDHFTGRFNEHLADKILLFVDEGFWAGDKKAEGTLKGLITEKTRAYEGKGKPVVQGPNQLHVVMASNEDWVIPASADERRFAVFETDAAAAKAFPHFDALIDEGSPERAGILSAMLHDLLSMDLGGWHPRKDIPQTEALLDQKMEGLVKNDPLAAWWYGCLHKGRIDEMDFPNWPKGCEWPNAWMAGPEAKALMLQSAKDSDKRLTGTTDKRLVKYLASVGVEHGEKVRNKDNKRSWAIPALDDARRAFEAKMGGAFEWPD